MNWETCLNEFVFHTSCTPQVAIIRIWNMYFWTTYLVYVAFWKWLNEQIVNVIISEFQISQFDKF